MVHRSDESKGLEMSRMLPYGSKPQVSGYYWHLGEKEALSIYGKPRLLEVRVETDEVFEMRKPPWHFKKEAEKLSKLKDMFKGPYETLHEALQEIDY